MEDAIAKIDHMWELTMLHAKQNAVIESMQSRNASIADDLKKYLDEK